MELSVNSLLRSSINTSRTKTLERINKINKNRVSLINWVEQIVDVVLNAKDHRSVCLMLVQPLINGYYRFARSSFNWSLSHCCCFKHIQLHLRKKLFNRCCTSIYLHYHQLCNRILVRNPSIRVPLILEEYFKFNLKHISTGTTISWLILLNDFWSECKLNGNSLCNWTEMKYKNRISGILFWTQIT